MITSTIRHRQSEPLALITADITGSDINEGDEITYTITTENIPDGTVLYWSNTGTTSAADFTQEVTSGTFIVNNSVGTVTLSTVEDMSSEGTETIVFSVQEFEGIVLDTISHNVLDSSIMIQPLSFNLVNGERYCNNSTTAVTHKELVGGNPPYTFSWSNGSSQESIEVGAGTYTLTINDTPNIPYYNGTSFSRTVTLENISAVTFTHTLINNNEVRITPSGGSEANYMVNLYEDGINTQNDITSAGNSVSFTLPNLNSEYRVIVSNIRGCSSGDPTLVRRGYTPISITDYNKLDVSCNDGSDGQVTFNVNGGEGALTYIWTNGVSSTNAASGLSAGTYTMTVTDLVGQTASQQVTITQPSAINITISNVTSNQFTVSASGGGTSNYTIAIGTEGTGWAYSTNNHTFTDLSPDTEYPITVYSHEYCGESTSVTTLSSMVVSNVTTTHESCGNNTNDIIGGSASVSVSGGSGNYSYAWSNGASGSNVSNLNNGSYSVTVTDSSWGDSATRAFTINDLQPISITSTEITNSYIKVVPSGGSTGTYYYEIEPYLQGSNLAQGTNMSWSGASPNTTYTIKIWDNYQQIGDSYVGSGCYLEHQVTTASSLSGGIVSTTPVSCYNYNDGTATITGVGGGSGIYSYNWFPHTTTGPNATGLPVSNTSNTVEVSDAGDNWSGSILLSYTIENTTQVAGSFTSTENSIQVTATGGTGSYNSLVLWEGDINATQTQAGSLSQSGNIFTITGLNPGTTYHYNITDSNGCTVTSGALTENILPTITGWSQPEQACPVGSVSDAGNSFAIVISNNQDSSNTNTYYLKIGTVVDAGGRITNITQSVQMVAGGSNTINLSGGTHYAIISTSQGSSTSAQITNTLTTITVNSSEYWWNASEHSPPQQVSPSSFSIPQPTGNVSGAIDVYVDGALKGNVTAGSAAQLVPVNGLTPCTTYSIEYKKRGTNCTYSYNASTIASQATVNIEWIRELSCTESPILGATVTGDTEYTVQLQSSDGTWWSTVGSPKSSSDTLQWNVNADTEYRVKVTACQGTPSAQSNSLTANTNSLTSPGIEENGDPSVTSHLINYNNYQGGSYSVYVNGSQSMIVANNAFSLTGLDPGTQYSVYVNHDGCLSNTISFTTAQCPVSIGLAVNNSVTSCFGAEDGQLSATHTSGYYTYAWTDAQGNPIGGNTPTISNLSPGTYTVIVSSYGGACTYTASGTVSDRPELSTTVELFDHFSATVSASGGTGPYTITNNTTQQSLTAVSDQGVTFTNLSHSTEYTYTVEDSNECVTTGSFTTLTMNLTQFYRSPNSLDQYSTVFGTSPTSWCDTANDVFTQSGPIYLIAQDPQFAAGDYIRDQNGVPQTSVYYTGSNWAVSSGYFTDVKTGNPVYNLEIGSGGEIINVTVVLCEGNGDGDIKEEPEEGPGGPGGPGML